MAIFISTYRNKIDKKGRVSVPAAFRTVLANQNFSGIIAYPSFIHSCIESSGIDRIERLSASIDNLDPYSDERDAFALSILGGAEQLGFDQDGRVMLPEKLVDFAKLSEEAIFVGKGQTFEIWNPKEFEIYAEKARILAKEKRGVLKP
jgi:MraZ protein